VLEENERRKQKKIFSVKWEEDEPEEDTFSNRQNHRIFSSLLTALPAPRLLGTF